MNVRELASKSVDLFAKALRIDLGVDVDTVINFIVLLKRIVIRLDVVIDFIDLFYSPYAENQKTNVASNSAS